MCQCNTNLATALGRLGMISSSVCQKYLTTDIFIKEAV